ncbi:hypothetical protein N9948_00535 [bacterium]|nr:hypothetical protein [bacterium]
MKDKNGNKVDIGVLGELILKHLKDTWKYETRNSGITAQGVYAYLSSYQKIEISVAQARKVLSKLEEEGKVREGSGAGRRANYILIKKENSVEFISEA